MGGLSRSDIQTEINKAHIKIDELTALMARRHDRGHDYYNLALDIFKAINYIRILENDEAITDKAVELFIQALRELLGTYDIDYEPTTLNLTNNQPALKITNELTVDDSPYYFARYDSTGKSIESAGLAQFGDILSFDGTTLELGSGSTSQSSRTIKTVGSAATIDLTVITSGDLTLQQNELFVKSPVKLDQTLYFKGETTNVSSISDDETFASPSANALVTERAIDARIDSEVATLNTSISNATKYAGSGLTETSQTFDIVGNVTKNADLALQTGIRFKLTSPSATAGFEVVADTSFNLFGPNGYLKDTGTGFEIGAGVLNYDSDRSASYGSRSVTDKNYQDSTIGGKPVAAIVKSPGSTENDYSVVWDNAAGNYTLKAVSGGSGGSGGNADTLDGLDSTQFLRSDVDTTALGTVTFDRSAKTSTAGKEFIKLIHSSDNTVGRITVGRSGSSSTSGVEFWSSDDATYTKIIANTFESKVASGTAPFTVASSTVVSNLNSDKLDGYDASSSVAASTVAVRDGVGGIAVARISGITYSDVVANLNADLVDGLNGWQFLRSDADDSTVNVIDFQNNGSSVGKVALKGTTSRTLELYYSSDNRIDLLNSTSLVVRGASALSIAKFTQSETLLYYQGSEKLKTTSAGVTVTGTVTADNFIDSSDVRLKKNVQMVDDDILNKFSKINIVEYIHKNTGDFMVGVIADELEKILPQFVYYNDDGYKAVDYRSLFAITLLKVQLLEAKLNGK